MSQDTLNEIFKMTQTDVICSSALSIRWSSIVIDEMDVQVSATMSGRWVPAEDGELREEPDAAEARTDLVFRPGKLLQRVIDEHWKRFVYDVYAHFFMFGFCPYVVEKRPFDSSDDDEVNRRYPKRRTRTTLVSVPIVPRFGTWIAVLDVSDTEPELVVFMTPPTGGQVRINCVRSVAHAGPIAYASIVGSPGALLLESYREYVSMERKARHALTVMMNPKQMLQGLQTTVAVDTLIDSRAAMDAVDQAQRDMDTNALGMATHDPRDRFIENLGGQQELSKRVVKGEVVDPAENACVLPRFHSLAQNVQRPLLPALVERYREMHEANVAHTLQMPMRYIQTRPLGINKFAASGVAEEDAKKMARSTRQMRDDLVQAMREVWLVVQKERNVQFTLPVRDHVDMETLLQTARFGVVRAESIAALVSEATGIQRAHFVDEAHSGQAFTLADERGADAGKKKAKKKPKKEQADEKPKKAAKKKEVESEDEDEKPKKATKKKEVGSEDEDEKPKGKSKKEAGSEDEDEKPKGKPKKKEAGSGSEDEDEKPKKAAKKKEAGSESDEDEKPKGRPKKKEAGSGSESDEDEKPKKKARKGT